MNTTDRGLLPLELQLHLQLLQLAGRAGLRAAAHARQLRQQLGDGVHHGVARRRRQRRAERHVPASDAVSYVSNTRLVRTSLYFIH